MMFQNRILERFVTPTVRWDASAATVVLIAVVALGPDVAYGLGDDVFDPFYRYNADSAGGGGSLAPVEEIDPFTGTLRINHTDLTFPGRGGHALSITRQYTSKIWGRANPLNVQEAIVAHKELSYMGWGWSYHMGRIRNPFAVPVFPQDTCSDPSPVFETPDGRQEIFHWATDDSGWESKSGWRINTACRPQVVCVYTDTGMTYEFAYADTYYYGWQSGSANQIIPAKKIIDTHGNAVTMTYKSNPFGFVETPGRLDKIVDSWGRTITFHYGFANGNSEEHRLLKIRANGKEWRFKYTTIDTGWPMFYHKQDFLTEVIPPSGPSWKYTYFTRSDYPASNAFGLRSMTSPSGGTVTYEADATQFGGAYEYIYQFPITRRIESGRGVPTPNPTWTYLYDSDPDNSSGDTTTIIRPDGSRDVHTFYGFGAVTNQQIWKVGLPIRRSIADGERVEVLTWEKGAKVSDRGLVAPAYRTCGPFFRFDHGIYRSRLKKREITQDGRTFTTSYSNFDAYGQPELIAETGHLSRTTTLDHWYNVSKHMLKGRRSYERVCTGGDCYVNRWTYDTGTGDVRTEDISGVVTTKSYYSDGSLRRITDPEGKWLELSNYDMGVPERISFHGLFSVTRSATWEGKVDWETDGRGKTTDFDYDGSGRLTVIDGPDSAPVYFTYASDGSWTQEQRGSYYSTTSLDGLGRQISTSNSEGVWTRRAYDRLGRASYQSYPYGGGTAEYGDTMTYDGLGRVRSVRHSDSTTITNSYGGNSISTTIVTNDELNHNTTKHFRAFGDPADKRLWKVIDANGKTTVYTYDAHGSLTSVDAPGLSGDREYGYNSMNHLTREENPESGVTTYDPNGVGLNRSRTDAFGTTYFSYDDLHRIEAIDYPGGSGDDVTMDHDNAGNLTLVDSVNGGRLVMSHDGANRLSRQTWTYADNVYVTDYIYNSSNDCLELLRYPTGLDLSMSCDTMSRTNSITDYVSNVQYHAGGQIRSLRMAGITETTTFDSRGRIDTRRAGSAIDLDVDWDGVGNLTKYWERRGSTNKWLIYDNLNRLTSASGPWGSSTFSYDDLGNRKSKFNGGRTDYSYDSRSGRLTHATGQEAETFAYDAVGNLKTRDGFVYNWDPAHRLISSSDGTAYWYDGRGKRVQKASSSSGETVLFHYDDAGRLIAETWPDGQLVREYVYLSGRLVASYGRP